MNIKNQCLQNFALSTPAKTLCAKFGFQTQSIMVSGDDKSIISLWRLGKNEPKATINCAQILKEEGKNSAISYVCFAPSENEVYSGTTQGSLYLWDIRNQKLSQIFQGHESKITYIIPSSLPGMSNIALTGSTDMTVRQWDSRQRNSVTVYSGHKAGVNCIDFSPNGEIFATGSEDGELKLWDIRTHKCVQTFDLEKSPVTSIAFNPEEIALAVATGDGRLRYFNLERYELEFDAKGEKNSIQQIYFGLNAKYIFTSGQKSLKVWEVDAQNLRLLDQVQTQCLDVQDIRTQVQKTSKDRNETVVRVTISPSFGLWASSSGSLNRDPKKAVSVFENLKSRHEEDSEIPNEMIKPTIRGTMIKNSNYISFDSPQFSNLESPYKIQQQQGSKENAQGIGHVDEETKFDPSSLTNQERQKPSPSDNKAPLGDTHPAMNPVTVNEFDPEGEGEGDDVVGDMVASLEENLQINDLLESTRSMMESLIKLEQNSPSDLNLESYIKGITNEEKNREYDIISEIRGEHAKFKAHIIQRGQNLKSITDKWRTPFASKTIPMIDSLKLNDCPIIISLINTSVVAYRLEKVPLDVVCALLRKTPFLLQTTSDIYILIAFGFILAAIAAFKKDVVPKPNQTPKKLNQAKAELPKLHAKFVEALEALAQTDYIKDASAKNETQAEKRAKEVLTKVTGILNDVRGKR